jgi:uracil-DNA glycosylase
MNEKKTVEALIVLHAELDACRVCPKMIGPVVHGPPVPSKILLVGQAPGPREGSFGRPFAWTAGKTLFRWFFEATGIGEDAFRRGIYMAAVARCFPGKSSGGGDRRPDAKEIEACKTFLAREVAILRPALVIPVGTLAIDEVLGKGQKLANVIGTVERVRYHGVDMDAICLPHPSGASPWHKVEPGKALLGRAMKRIAEHPEVKRVRDSDA